MRARHEPLPQTPAGIVGSESVDEFIFREEVVEGEVQFGQAIHVGSGIPQMVGQSTGFDQLFRFGGIVEEQCHLMTTVEHLLLERREDFIEFSIAFRRGNVDAVVRYEVIHVVLAGIHINIDGGIQRFEFQTEIGHTQHTTSDGRRVSLHLQGLLHERRVVDIHAMGNGPVLSGTETSKVAIAFVSISVSPFQPVERILSLGGQQPHVVSGVEFVDKVFVRIVISHVTCPVSPIVGDVEGFVACRWRCNVARGVGIVAVIGGGQFGM